MALTRSASGPGGLSINTGSANSIFGSGSTPASGGMFGSTQASKPLFGAATTTTAPQSGGLFGTATSQPAAGLFGSTAATTPQPQTGGLFGSAATSQPQTSGLFGSAATSQPQTSGLFGSAATSQPQTGGLFGSTATTSQPQTGGLFGSAATSQPQTGGLFGSTATTSQPQTGGLFGNNNMSQTASPGGLFGSSTTQPQQTSGLFGGLGSNQNQNTGGGLFGASSTQQNQSGGLFGSGLNAQNQNQPAATSMFGGLGSNQNQNQQSNLFSSQQSQQPLGGALSSNQQQQTAPGVRIDLTNIKGSTRISDLHEDLQKKLADLDGSILSSMDRMKECAAFMPGHEKQLDNVPTDVEFCSRKLRGLADLMDGDTEAVFALKNLIEEDAEQAKLSFRAIDNLKLPPQYHNSGHWPTKATGGDSRAQGNAARDGQEIVGYFSSTADELNTKLAKHQKNITAIESHLRGVEASTAQQIHNYVARRQGGSAAQSDQIQELAESLQDFERGVLNVAGKVGSTREQVQSLQLGGFIRPTNSHPTNTSRSNVY